MSNIQDNLFDISSYYFKNPKNISTFVKSGKEKWQSKDIEGAYDDFKEAITINSKDHYAYFCLANLDTDYGKEDDAIKNYTKAIQLNFDSDIYVFYLEAFKENQLKDYKVAIEYFSKVLEIDPNDDIAYYFRGLSKSLLEDDKGAISDFSKSIEINPLNVHVLEWCAYCYKDLKDFQNSILFYSQAIKVLLNYPKHPLTSDAESRLFNARAMAKYKSGDIKGFLNDKDKASEIEPYKHWSISWTSRFREQLLIDHPELRSSQKL